jgi:type IV secretion system protein VirB10
MSMPPPMPAIATGTGSATERLRAPAVVFDSGTANPASASAMAPAAAPVAAPAKTPLPRDSMSPEDLFAERVSGKADTATPDRMTSPATTVAQGTLMTAVLETAINSDLQGYVRAMISQDVKSYDGRRVLIPRGSHLIGEYKSGLAVGQSRAYVLWTRLLRPDGISIALASPATDYSGQNGLGGKVDSHFIKRFGAAILLSVIGAAGQAVGGGTGTVILSGPQQAVSAGAQRDISIPPTVKVGLGQPIRVFTARDLDFSSVNAAP